MRCRTCGYSLWNLPRPQCPECGTGFDLRTYRFVPGTVGFACPHCGHLHGGAGEHHIPSSEDQVLCLNCGRAINVVEMRVVPLTDDLSKADASSADLIPWEERKTLGFWPSLWRTIKLSMLDPKRLGESLHDGTRFVDGYFFAFWCNFVGALVNAFIFILFYLGMMIFALATQPSSTSGGSAGPVVVFGINIATQIFGLALTLVTPLLYVGITGGTAHLFLRYFGPNKAGFHRTAMSVLYGQGPMAIGVIPFVGAYVGMVWTLVSVILILTRSQGVSGLKATIACLWFSLLLLVSCCGLMGLIFGIFAFARIP